MGKMSTRLYVSTNEASFFNTNMMGCSSSPPSEGSYIIGDFFISTVQQQGVFGWVCVESGSPGVWEDICNIGDINESIKQNQNNIEDLRLRVEAAEKIVNDLELSAGVDLLTLEKTVNNAVIDINNHEEDILYLKSIDSEIKATVSNTQNIANSNKDNIASLTTQVGLNDRDIDNLKITNNEIKTNVSATQNIANTNKDNIASLTAQVGLNDKDIDTIRNLVTNLTNELNGLKSDLNLSDSDITGIRNQLSSITNTLNLIEVKLNGAVTDIDILESNFNNLSGTGIQDISKSINDNKNNIANIEKNVDNITNTITTLTKNVSDNKTITATLETRINGYNENVVEITKLVNNNTTEIEKNKTQINNHSTDISNLKHQHTRQEQDIQSLENQLTGLNTTVGGIESTISGLSTKVNTNIDSTNNINNELGLLKTKVDNDIDNLATLKSGFIHALTTKGIPADSDDTWKQLFLYLVGITNVITYPCTKVTLNKNSISFSEIGQMAIIYASTVPENTTDKVIWRSSNESVASVSEGVVISNGAGNCIIYAKCGNQEVSCNINVNVVVNTCKGMTLAQNQLTLYATGDSSQLTAILEPEGCTDPITWSSSNTSIATVDSSGLVKPINVGNVTITAKCGAYASTCQVRVVTRHVCTGLSFVIDSVTIGVGIASPGYYLAQYLRVAPLVCTDTVYWSSSNTRVATVDSKGSVMPVSIGETIITVNCGSKEISIPVYVEEDPL
jgi:predicted  nucleic acid-binding Zn-ribbon protein